MAARAARALADAAVRVRAARTALAARALAVAFAIRVRTARTALAARALAGLAIRVRTARAAHAVRALAVTVAVRVGTAVTARAARALAEASAVRIRSTARVRHGVDAEHGRGRIGRDRREHARRLGAVLRDRLHRRMGSRTIVGAAGSGERGEREDSDVQDSHAARYSTAEQTGVRLNSATCNRPFAVV